MPTGFALLAAAAVPIFFGAASLAGDAPDETTDFSARYPPELRGPFVSDPAVVTALDCGESATCDGPLNFQRLIEAKAASSGTAAAHGTNPFKLPISKKIIGTIETDLAQIRKKAGAGSEQLDFHFLTHPETRAELVGVVNRMDRQFIKDSGSDLTPAQQACGEISLIYRFSYFIKANGGQKSRMPLTMNIVFPALPGDTKGGAIACQGVAKRWRDEYQRPEGRSPQQIVAGLLDNSNGPLALIRGEDMLRIELNMQAYRLPAGDPSTSNFGSQAEYLIRVFKWADKLTVFEPTRITNQINRDALLCGHDSSKVCKNKKRPCARCWSPTSRIPRSSPRSTREP